MAVPRTLLAALAALLLSNNPGTLAAQALDLCGCGGIAALRPFDAGDPVTYPAGTKGCVSRCDAGTIVLPLPDDGVLRFSRFTADGRFTIGVASNARNTPVTILVSGDVTLRAPDCCGTLSVSGGRGADGTAAGAGLGGVGGPGGFAGGYGAAQPITGFTIGGNGLGPGGGVGATTTIQGIGGMFTGNDLLQPLIGGSGGGGGSGFEDGATCTGGGGGGGGGALLLAANGRMTLRNFQVHADGGSGGEVGSRACAQGGAGGSGGAVRLVAGRFVDEGMTLVTARGGAPGFRGAIGTAGRVRLESLDDSALQVFVSEPSARRVRVE